MWLGGQQCSCLPAPLPASSAHEIASPDRSSQVYPARARNDSPSGQRATEAGMQQAADHEALKGRIKSLLVRSRLYRVLGPFSNMFMRLSIASGTNSVPSTTSRRRRGCSTRFLPRPRTGARSSSSLRAEADGLGSAARLRLLPQLLHGRTTRAPRGGPSRIPPRGHGPSRTRTCDQRIMSPLL